MDPNNNIDPEGPFKWAPNNSIDPRGPSTLNLIFANQLKNAPYINI